MTKKTTITINGRLYDVITGMPVAATPHQPAKQVPSARRQSPLPPQRAFSDISRPIITPTPADPRPAAQPDARTVHQHAQKSQTLYRKALKKPLASATAAPGHRQSQARVPAPVHRSPLIKKFADQSHSQDSTEHQQPAPIIHNQPHALNAPAAIPTHPTVDKVIRTQAERRLAAAAPQPSGKELKEMLIKERLSEVSYPKKESGKQASWLARQPRLITILTATLALLLLGGYLTYMTLPSISMRVAASRAGVDAGMPNYKPDGFSLSGPITYSPGEVVINYKSNTNQNSFTLRQKASNWDSQAVLDNYVMQQTDNYLTFQERGLTVYTFGDKAAWVNGGLLYTLEGDAGLSSEQILRVATSM